MSNLKEDRPIRQGYSTILLFIMLLFFVAYAWLRWESEAPALTKFKRTADTPAYFRVANEDLFSRDFWGNTRPPMFPLVIKALNSDAIRVVQFQTAFSIVSWGLFALSVAYQFKSLLRTLAFGLILAISMEHHIAGWDVVLLTESLSISLLVLFLASWLWLLQSWSWWKVIQLIFVAFAWAFTRDTNAWLLLMVAGMILLAVLMFGAHKRYLSIALIFFLIFTINDRSANIGNRWLFPFQNVLAQRILTDQTAIEFFAECGMPITSELLGMAGGYANSGDRAFYNDPTLDSYRTWVHPNGKACLMRWLLSRPLASLREPWEDFEWLLVFEEVSRFFPQRYDPILPWYAERILYPQNGTLWLWTLTTFSALVAIWKRAWQLNHTWVVFLGLCLLIYPHLFIVWHGDVPGTHRHALTISLQFVLSFWLLGLLVAEWILVYVGVNGQREKGA